MIRDDRRREKAGELEPAVAVGRAHHSNFDALIAQSSDTSGRFSLDCAPAFELESVERGEWKSAGGCRRNELASLATRRRRSARTGG